MVAKLRLQTLDKSKGYSPFRCAPWCLSKLVSPEVSPRGSTFRSSCAPPTPAPSAVSSLLAPWRSPREPLGARTLPAVLDR